MLDATSIITHVRAYYDGNKSFVDYPAVTTGTAMRWSILDLSKVRSKDEALALATKHYDKRKNGSFTVDVKLSGQGSETNPYFSDGKYGYIADPALVTLEVTNYHKYASSWTSLYGGIPYPGMVNALDGISRSDKTGAITSAIFNDRTIPLASKVVQKRLEEMEVLDGLPLV